MGSSRLFRLWDKVCKVMGPAFLVSVAYLDPGNWATAIEGGSRYGYDLLWIVVLSNLIAILLQTLAARLGLVTGRHLAQICRQEYPRPVCWALWALAEVSVVALDLTMVLGTAIGLNLLSGNRLPLHWCIFLTGLDALVLFLLLPRMGGNRAEGFTVVLMGAVLLCIVVDLFICKPPVTSVVNGLVPKLHMDSLYIAVSMLGANIMPHNFYLHSALVTRQASERKQPLGTLCWFNFIDIACALTFALLINAAVLIIAAATFNSAGEIVLTLQDAHDMMESILSSSVAPAAFGIALVCAGQLSTFTGTISGQVILKGFLNIRCSTWVRRLVTRSLAIIPALLLQVTYGDEATYKLLVMTQVVLSLQLPCTLVPLIQATSCYKLMGDFANRTLLKWAAWACTGLISVANILLFVELVYPDNWKSSGKSFWNYAVAESAEMAVEQPLQFNLVVALGLVLAITIALLMYMFTHPISGKGMDPKNMSRAFSQAQVDPNLAYHFFVRTSCGRVDASRLIFTPPSMTMDAPLDSKVVLLAPPVEAIPEGGKDEDDPIPQHELDDWEALADEIMNYVQRPSRGDSVNLDAATSQGAPAPSQRAEPQATSQGQGLSQKQLRPVSNVLATARVEDVQQEVQSVYPETPQASASEVASVSDSAQPAVSERTSQDENDQAAANKEESVGTAAVSGESMAHPSVDSMRRRKGSSVKPVEGTSTVVHVEPREGVARDAPPAEPQLHLSSSLEAADHPAAQAGRDEQPIPEVPSTSSWSALPPTKEEGRLAPRRTKDDIGVMPTSMRTAPLIPPRAPPPDAGPPPLPPRTPSYRSSSNDVPASRRVADYDSASGRRSVDLPVLQCDDASTSEDAMFADARTRLLGRSLSDNRLPRPRSQGSMERNLLSPIDPSLTQHSMMGTSGRVLDPTAATVDQLLEQLRQNALPQDQVLSQLASMVQQQQQQQQADANLWAADNLANNLESYLQPHAGSRSVSMSHSNHPMHNGILNPAVQNYLQSRVGDILQQARVNDVVSPAPEPMAWDGSAAASSAAWQEHNINLAAQRVSAALGDAFGTQSAGVLPPTPPSSSLNTQQLLSNLLTTSEPLLNQAGLSASAFNVNGDPVMAVPYHLQQQLGAMAQPILSVPPLERLQHLITQTYSNLPALPPIPRPPSVYEDLLNINNASATYDTQLNVAANSVVNHILQGIATNEQAAQVLTSESTSATPQSIHCSGMSKGSRREFATLLDKFWSEHFDLHGSTITRGPGKRGNKGGGGGGGYNDAMGEWTPWGSNSRGAALMMQHSNNNAIGPAKQMVLEVHRTVTDCVNELAVLKGSEWLFEVYFPTNGGIRDHEKRVTIQLRQFLDALNTATTTTMGELPGHRDDVSMLYSFGIWCIVRVMQLCQAEPRPELWGKYAFVLNRLQGVLSLIPRSSVTAVEVSATVQLAQAAIQGKRGPAGTAAGDVAFPKGKEIIISVFKRYRRTLQGQACDGPSTAPTSQAQYNPNSHPQVSRSNSRRGNRPHHMH